MYKYVKSTAKWNAKWNWADQKEINLLQERLQKNEKSLSQFQNGLMRIKKIRVKKRQRQDFSQTKKNKKYSEEYIAK